MTQGIKVFDETGAALFETETKAIRSTASISVSGGQSGSFSVPEFDEANGLICVDFFPQFASGNTGDYVVTWSWDNSSKVFTYDITEYSADDQVTFNFLSIL